MTHSDSQKNAVGRACNPNGISNHAALPTDPQTGLTLPLSKSLASQDLERHRAMIAFELEVMAKKLDRFGWDRDRNSAAHDRLVVDWMDALQDYPLDEVQAACRAWVKAQPRRMPNEGDILGEIQKARRIAADRFKASQPKPAPNVRHITDEQKARVAEIVRAAGFGESIS